MEKVLEECGLTSIEVKVYLALLELGTTTAGPLIKKVNLHRATVYDALNRLTEKGLVGFIVRGKMKQYSAQNPTALLNLQEEKLEKLKEIIPKLEMKHKKQLGQEVTVYQGKKGIKTVLEMILDELKPNGTYYDFGVSGLFREIMPEYWDVWQHRKKLYHIKSLVIFNEELKRKNPQLLKNYVGEYKFHKKEFSSPTDTVIFNDTVVLFIWTASPPIAVVIKNKENAEGYKNQFKLMWEHCKKN